MGVEREIITVGVRELRANMSRYLRLAGEGRTVVVMSRGAPIAKLGPHVAASDAPMPATADQTKRRKPGVLKGKIWMADDFDEWPEDILASFEARLS